MSLQRRFIVGLLAIFSLLCLIRNTAKEDRLAMAMPGTEHLIPQNQPIHSSCDSTTLAPGSSHSTSLQKDNLIGRTLARAMSSMPSGDLGTPDPSHISDPDGNLAGVGGNENPQSEQEEVGNQDATDEMDSDSTDSDDDEERSAQEKYLKNKERQIAVQKALEEVNKNKWADLAGAFEKETESKSRAKPKPKSGAKSKSEAKAKTKATMKTKQTDKAGEGETQKPSSTPNEQLADSPRSSTLPLPSFDNQDSWPKWLHIAVDSLTDEEDGLWTSLLSKFIAFEQHLGFPEKMVIFFHVCSSAC
jgi:hypothetical protein